MYSDSIEGRTLLIAKLCSMVSVAIVYEKYFADKPSNKSAVNSGRPLPPIPGEMDSGEYVCLFVCLCLFVCHAEVNITILRLYHTILTYF